MNIIIKLDTVEDKETLDGFALATGWNDKLGKTTEQWLNAKVKEFVTRSARSGYSAKAASAKRTEYVSVVQAAAASAKTAIPEPTVSAEAALAEGIK